MTEGQTGYALLITGFVIMIFCLVYILLVFTGQRDPFQVVSIPAPKIDFSSLMGGPGLAGMNLGKTELEVIPTSEFNKIINMGISLLLSGFVMSFGFKIASLGVMLIRPIKINAKQEANPIPKA